MSAEESWMTLVRSLKTPSRMRTQCHTHRTTNNWDDGIISEVNMLDIIDTYFFIDDVISNDANGIFQFLVSSSAPPPVIAGHNFRKDFTERVVSLLQRSRLGVQTETKVSHR